jgi:glycosyltransferase involved in cell wall biosynthesis
MNVTYYQRHPGHGTYSLERLFQDVRRALPEDMEYQISIARFESRGILRRVYNMLEAAFRQSDVNHVTGDVHYLSYFLRRNRTLLTIHDCVSLERLKGLKKKIFFFLWYWLPDKRVALISVISESTKNEVLRYLKCNPVKIKVVPNCVSSEFKPFPRVFDSKKPNILQVGTSENKNLLRIAEALEGIPCHLQIVGRLSNIQETTLKQFGIKFSTVANISDQEMVEIYRQCDLLVFASTYEGFGLPILEAQATGRPVITSNISSMPQVAGNAACLVDPFNIQSIRSGILKVIREAGYREELIENGFKNVERFSPKKIADEYVKLYKEIMGNS